MPSAKGPTKLFHARTTSSPLSIISLTRTPLVQILCLLIGLIGFIAFLASLNCTPRSQTRSVSVFWDRGDIVDGTHQGSLFIGDGERSKVMGFVGIFTGFGSVGRRKVLRQTWLPSDPTSLQRLEESTGLTFRFIIGRSKEEWKMSVLKKEIDRYDDFILLDIEEQYSKLPYKTLAFFKAAYALYDTEFYVKADDDIYLRPDRLSLLLAKERSHPQTYLGCMKKGPVFTDPHLKWYEPLAHLLGNEYFLHAYGPLYALSAKVVRSLVALRNDSFRMFSNEDVTIGSWMLAMNVNHENYHELCSPKCTATSVAVWDIPQCSGLCNPEQRMLELHKMEECTGNAATTEADE